jgi:hypothetical protein
MKHSIVLTISMCIIICFSKCNQKNAHELPSSNPDSVKKIIIALNDVIFHSMDNPEKFQSFCEDSMLTSLSDGAIVTSSKKISHDLLHIFILPHDYTFRLFGNTAVLSYLSTGYEIINDDTIFYSLRNLKTFVFDNGKWRVACVGGAEVPINYVRSVVDKHEKDYASYAGYYQSKKGEVDTVFVKDGKLYDKSGGGENLNFSVNDNAHMIMGDLGRLSFGKDSKGGIAYYTITNPDGQKYKCPKLN